MASPSEFHTQAMLAAGTIQDETGADAAYDALDGATKESLNQDAGDLRVISKMQTALMGTAEAPGSLTQLLTVSLDGHTKAIDSNLERTIHEKLDQRGVPKSPQHNLLPKPPKPGAKPVPDGMVTQETHDALVKQFNQTRTRDSIRTAAAGAKFMSPSAMNDAVDFLSSMSKLDDDGNVIVEMEVEDAITKTKTLRSLQPAAAIEALKGHKSYLFEAKAPGGSGGGGGDLDARGGEALPKVASYQDLLRSPDLLHRYMTEKPDEFLALKEQHLAGVDGELGNVLSGKGLSAQSTVNAAVAGLRQRQSGAAKL